MNAIKSIINDEPVAVAFAINAIVLLGMAFGLMVTTVQLAAINVAVAAVLAVVVRQKVTPVAS